MNVIDIIIVVCCIPAVFRGISKGFVAQAASLVSLVLGAWLSFKFSGPVAGWLKSFTEMNGTLLQVIAFVLILVIVVLILDLVGKTLDKLIKVVMLGWLNKLLGVAFALLKALLVIGLVILLFDAVYTKVPFVSTKVLDESILYHPVKDIADIVFPYLKSLIFNK